MQDVATYSSTPAFVPGTVPDLSLSPTFQLPHALALRFGGEIKQPKLCYSLVGPSHAPVIVIQGGISADVQVSHGQGRSGWWSDLVGPDAAIDTRQFRILSFAYLGGCHGSSGPGEKDLTEFPSVSTQDQARGLAALLDHLEIDALHAFIGASYGGMVGLAFAQHYPHRLKQLIAICAPAKASPLGKAWRITQRRVVRFGLEFGRGSEALAIARGLAMTTYRTAEDFAARFEGPPIPGATGFTFPLEPYLDHCGTKFTHDFDPRSFLCLSESIDLHEVQPEKISTPTTLIGVPSDQLVPLENLRELCGSLKGPAVLLELTSKFGHDAFLKEPERLGAMLERVLLKNAEVVA